MATYNHYVGTLPMPVKDQMLHITMPSSNAFPPSVYFPVPVASDLKGGTVGIAYSATISAQGGMTPYSFAVTAGTLPIGTSLFASTGVISGTPTTVGTYSFTVTVTDASTQSGSQGFVIIISGAATSVSNYGYTG